MLLALLILLVPLALLLMLFYVLDINGH